MEVSRKNIELFAKSALPETNFSFRLLNADMNSIPLTEQFDIVIAIGTLHHTPSVLAALQSTYLRLKPAGTYIGWIINNQKPLRSFTDEYFRQYFTDSSKENYFDQDLTGLSYIFKSLGEALGDQSILIKDKITCLDLEPGSYQLQTLLYDYFLKCYYKSGTSSEGLTRIKAQLWDWFVPKYYHQTSQEELSAMIIQLEGSTDSEIITKTNGHFFKFIKIHNS